VQEQWSFIDEKIILFLEMNTRFTGGTHPRRNDHWLDLVELQIKVARGEALEKTNKKILK
jgi:acetyl/propionyl-CoA carboxylase alpha subunit